jgi:hypothetical protein
LKEIPLTLYHINEGPQSPAKRFRYRVLFGTLWLLGFSLIERLANGRWMMSPTALVIGGSVAYLGALLTTILWPPQQQAFDLELDDQELRLVWNGEVLRRVRTDRVHYVAEKAGILGTKLVISEHESRWARSRRCINVHRRLLDGQQYERIKALALGWLQSAAR